MAFQRGQSGNPGGRSTEKLFGDALRVALAEEDVATGKKKLRMVADKLVEAAIDGQPWAVDMIANRVDGRVAQPVVGDEDGAPIRLELVRRIIVDPKMPTAS